MKAILERSSNRKKKQVRVQAVIVLLIAFVFCLSGYAFLKKPKAERALIVNNVIAEPQLSQPSGFYTSSFFLSLTSSNPQAKIYFTTDGTKPTIDSDLYQEPIQISSRADEPNKLSEIKNSPVFFYPISRVFKGCIVRAITVVNDSIKSQETVASYFIHPTGRSRYSLPVFSLVTDEENLFGYKNGIYINGATTDDKDYYLKNNISIEDYRKGFPTNYKRRGERWERPVVLDFFEGASNLGFKINAGVRIHGNATRERPQKSLKFYINQKYGDALLNYPLFGPGSLQQQNTFLLRNSGQDMYKARMRDALMQQILKGNTTLDLQNYRPSILFINGEYWGIHDIRQRVDEFYFSHKYNIPLDSLSILGVNMAVEYGKPADSASFVKLLNFVSKNNMAIPENYKVVESEMDVDNFIDYIIAEVYCSNPDWPHNNINLWRYNSGKNKEEKSFKDGRWRWALYDTDIAFGAERPASYNMLNYLLNKKGLGQLFNKLLDNKAFRIKFLERFEYHLENTFQPDKVIKIINSMEKEIAPEMEEHIARWRTFNSAGEWKKQVEVLRLFAKTRPRYQRQELDALKARYQQ
ncbi:CotH kinase family protein [Adhaeribacter rhizoryzae]|uniref:GH29D-like beta-sandwich domain-containing protein n=1 Tax=Adhaeribacter rhizoryzae TaxID=2607907 RepID=A0A5M6DPY8_9BACT|nr:CotH kinase family protein [Adhaeribacter rhizoryzae]KAA5548312.1 hypothetical protein F0145_06180 [Adhaeribacter rhizoryzae]